MGNFVTVPQAAESSESMAEHRRLRVKTGHHPLGTGTTIPRFFFHFKDYFTFKLLKIFY